MCSHISQLSWQKKNLSTVNMQKRYSRQRSLGYEAENYMDGVDNSYGVDNSCKWHAENLDENVDEDYTYKHGTAAAERRGTVSCEIIQRQLLNWTQEASTYIHIFL